MPLPAATVAYCSYRTTPLLISRRTGCVAVGNDGASVSGNGATRFATEVPYISTLKVNIVQHALL